MRKGRCKEEDAKGCKYGEGIDGGRWFDGEMKRGEKQSVEIVVESGRSSFTYDIPILPIHGSALLLRR